jgi:hypothetical protein
MEKVFYDYLGEKYLLKKSKYTNNGTLAVVLCNDEEEYVITVNLEWGFIINPQQQYVDTNNCPGIEEFLVENGIAKKIPNCEMQSGFCVYPLYEFNTGLMEEMK